MLTHEENERLTRVGSGTPGGELLRRYWQAVCPTAELTGSVLVPLPCLEDPEPVA